MEQPDLWPPNFFMEISQVPLDIIQNTFERVQVPQKGPSPGGFKFLKKMEKILQNLKYGLEPPIFGRSSSVIPILIALTIPFCRAILNIDLVALTNEM